MLWKKKQVGVAANLILCVALLMTGGVSQAVGESLIVEREFEVTQPKFLEISEPKFLEVSEPETQTVSELKSLKVSNPKSLKSGDFLRGKYTPAERENVEYNRCASQKGFNDQYKCALGSLGLTQEEIN